MARVRSNDYGSPVALGKGLSDATSPPRSVMSNAHLHLRPQVPVQNSSRRRLLFAAAKGARHVTGLVVLSLFIVFGVQSRAMDARQSADTVQLPTLVTGQVLDAAGNVDSSAKVLAFAVPDSTGVADGTSIPLTLASSSLGGTASYLLTALPTNLTDVLLNGTLNLELVATSGGQEMVTYLSLDAPNLINALLGNWTLSGTSASGPAPNVKFDFSDGSIRVTPTPDYADEPDGPPASAVYHDDPTPVTSQLSDLLGSLLSQVATSSSTASSSATGSSSDVALQSVPYCSLVTGAIDYNHTEHFVTTYTQSGIPERVTEGKSTTHTMGVEVRPAGGSWSANGTASITKTSTASVSVSYSGPHTTYNRVNYRSYSNSCTGRQTKSPYSFYDMLTDDGSAVSMVSYIYCGHHPAGAVWSTGTAKSATFGAGVSVSGVSLSAQSGYSSSVDLTYTFNVKGEVCGNNQAGPLYSSRVQADIW
jgi:hypothetical protein